MKILDILTWLSSIITVISMLITIWQACKVKTYKQQVLFDLRKIAIYEAGEYLRRAQEDCRKLLHSSRRGQNDLKACDMIQEYIDRARNRFNQKNSDIDIKQLLDKINQELRCIRGSSGSFDKLYEYLQAVTMLCSERIIEIR